MSVSIIFRSLNLETVHVRHLLVGHADEMCECVCVRVCVCVRECVREAILILNQLLLFTAYSCLLLRPQLIEIASNMKIINFVKNVLLNSFNAKYVIYLCIHKYIYKNVISCLNLLFCSRPVVYSALKYENNESF